MLRVICVGIFLCLTPTFALASDLENAPPAFGHRDRQAVPIDISTVDISMHFDYARRTASASATVVFTASAEGYPILDLVPNPSSVILNDEVLPTADFQTVSDPHQVTQFRVLKKIVSEGQTHVLKLAYNLSSDDVTFSSGNVRTGFFMSDLTTGGRSFFEQYGPANYEFDRAQYTFDVRLSGVDRDHEIFTNGEATVIADNHWSISFPEYFTTSMIYFHMTEADRFYVREATFAGQERSIPVKVYASSSSLANSGLSQALRVLAELEGTYGPYLHNSALAYITSGGGGMEYGGATMTSLGALGHEFTHFWFARGVMPSKGNSGWIDEAVASWRDNGYRRASGAPNRRAVNLGGFSPYRRHTTQDAYSLGRNLIEEFDYMFRDQGGMKAILKTMFAERGGTTISIGWFQEFLERETGHDLDAIFSRYVFGQSRDSGSQNLPDFAADDAKPTHPRPYTSTELEQYR